MAQWQMNIIELLLGLPDYQIKRAEVGETVQIETHGVADGTACLVDAKLDLLILRFLPHPP